MMSSIITGFYDPKRWSTAKFSMFLQSWILCTRPEFNSCTKYRLERYLLSDITSQLKFPLYSLTPRTIWTWKLLYVSNISTSIFEQNSRACQIIAWYKSQVMFAHAKSCVGAKWLLIITKEKYNYCFTLLEKHDRCR